jgi:hypothetical protein
MGYNVWLKNHERRCSRKIRIGRKVFAESEESFRGAKWTIPGRGPLYNRVIVDRGCKSWSEQNAVILLIAADQYLPHIFGLYRDAFLVWWSGDARSAFKERSLEMNFSMVLTSDIAIISPLDW